MEEKFENVVVGAGIAGLICGGYLSKAGQKTLILEKGKEPGGRAEVHKFNGYTSVFHLPAWVFAWNGGFWPTAARELGANINFFLSKEPKLYLRGSGQPPKVVPRCYTALAMTDFAASFLQSQFPGPLPKETREDFQRIFQEILSIPYKKMCVEMDTLRLKDWVEARSSDPMVQALFMVLAANMGFMVEPGLAWEVASAAKMCTMIRVWLAGEGGITVACPNPVDGIIKPFADAVKALGGEIRTEHEVTEVIVEKGRALGVAVKEKARGEKRIYADRVIVACPYNHVAKIFKKLPPELEEPIRKPGEILLMDLWTMTGLKKKITDDPSVVLVVDPNTGSNVGGVYAQSLEQPWNAPPGKQLIWMYKVCKQEEVESRTAKAIYADMNDIQEELYPGFKKAIEVQHHAAHQAHWHSQLSAFPKIPQKSSTVENLYFTGDGTAPQYGAIFDGSASTGILCAKRILGVDVLAGI